MVMGPDPPSGSVMTSGGTTMAKSTAGTSAAKATAAPSSRAGAARSDDRRSLARRTAIVAGVVLAIALAVFIVVYAASGFLLIFAGILFAVLLCALTDALGRIAPIGRGWRLAAVCVALLLAIGAFFTSVGSVAVSQTPGLIRTLESEISDLRDTIRNFSGVGEAIEDVTGIDTGLGGSESTSDQGATSGESTGNSPAAGEDGGGSSEASPGGLLADLLPDPSGLLGQVRVAFATTFGVLGNIGVIAVIGVYIAAQPSVYRNGAVKLVAPANRERFGEVLDEIGQTLRYWLIGQFVTMCIIGLIVWAALAAVGMPGAILLALTAALFNFIPIIGPILAGIPIVLVAMSQEWWVVIYALGVYVAVQILEGDVLTPLIQRRAIAMPPAVIMASLLIMGILFGLVGVVLATPLAAVIMVAVKRLYIEDVLGDRT